MTDGLLAPGAIGPAQLLREARYELLCQVFVRLSLDYQFGRAAAAYLNQEMAGIILLCSMQVQKKVDWSQAIFILRAADKVCENGAGIVCLVSDEPPPGDRDFHGSFLAMQVFHTFDKNKALPVHKIRICPIGDFFWRQAGCGGKINHCPSFLRSFDIVTRRGSERPGRSLVARLRPRNLPCGLHAMSACCPEIQPGCSLSFLSRFSNSLSAFAANMKSFSVNPSILRVHIRIVTAPHLSVISG